MSRIDDNSSNTHEKSSLLLPWYVNKTLQGNELAEVEQHLKMCLICKRELYQLQKLSVAINNQHNPMNGDPQASFASLKGRLPAKAKPQTIAPSIDTQVVIRPDRWVKKSGAKPYKWASLLAVAASILLAVLLSRSVVTEQFLPAVYQTQSSEHLVASNSNAIRLIFTANTSQQAIKQILAQIEGSIIAGPNEQSVYTIGFSKTVSTTDLQAKLKQLRGNPDIIFAEPGDGLQPQSSMGGDYEKPV